MKKKTTKTTKKPATIKKAPKAAKVETPAPDKNLKAASWLVARFRNALHQSQPELKEGKKLQGASTLSDLKAALAMTREEWENLLERFFNLGGKLEA